MIFNTVSYYVLFLAPAALAFRMASPAWQPWICSIWGAAFFIYFSLTAVGGAAGSLGQPEL